MKIMQITRFFFIILLLSVPLYFDTMTANQYLFPKIALFRFVSALIGILFSVQILFSKKRLLQKEYLHIPLALFLFTAFISLLGTKNCIVALDHIMMLTSGIILALWVLYDRDNVNGYLSAMRFFSFVVIFLSLHVLMQFAGWDIFAVKQLYKPFASFGNVNYLAQYLVMVLPLLLVLLFIYKSLWRYTVLFGLLAGIATVILTGSRGGFIALNIGLLTSLSLALRVFFAGNNSLRKICLYAIIGIVLILLITMMLHQHIPLFARLRTLFDSQFASNKFRMLTWKSALEIFRQHPLFGCGYGNFSYYYHGIRPLAERMISGAETYVLRAHNDYLQLLSEIGLCGLVAFIFLVISTFIPLGRQLRNREKSRLYYFSAGILGSLTGFLVHASVSFPFYMPGTQMLFWFCVGCAGCVFQKKRTSNYTSLLRNVIGIGILIFSLFSGYIVLREYYAQRLSAEGWQAYSCGNWERARECFEKSKRSWNVFSETYSGYGKTLMKLGAHADAIAVFTESLQIFPYNDLFYNNLGIIHEKNGNYQKALEAYATVLNVFPDSAEALYNSWKLLKKLQRDSEARILKDRLLAIKPRFAREFLCKGLILRDQKEWGRALEMFSIANEKDPALFEVFNAFATTYAAKGEYSKAETWLRKALQYEPKSALLHNNLANIYFTTGNLDKAINEYKQALKLDKRLIQAHYNLGILFLKRDEKELARKEFEMCLVLDNAFKPAKRILSSEYSKK